MKFFEIFNKFRLRRTGARQPRHFSGNLFLWFVLAVICLAEIYIVYTGVWKNIVFSDDVDPRTVDAAVRINFDNFNAVTERIKDVEEFRVPENIDLSGDKPNVGRQNPFADPE